MWKLALAITLAACVEHGSTPPQEPFGCGTETCQPGQLCATITAGLIGSFSVLSQSCIDRPTACGSEVTCECVQGCSLPTGVAGPARPA
jgi:hypothetical protein